MDRPPPMKLIKIGEEWLISDRDRNDDGSLRSPEVDEDEPDDYHRLPTVFSPMPF